MARLTATTVSRQVPGFGRLLRGYLHINRERIELLGEGGDMASSGVKPTPQGHLHQHMQETADMLGRRGRWVYLALVVLSVALMATMFLAYAELWPSF